MTLPHLRVACLLHLFAAIAGRRMHFGRRLSALSLAVVAFALETQDVGLGAAAPRGHVPCHHCQIRPSDAQPQNPTGTVPPRSVIPDTPDFLSDARTSTQPTAGHRRGSPVSDSPLDRFARSSDHWPGFVSLAAYEDGAADGDMAGNDTPANDPGNKGGGGGPDWSPGEVLDPPLTVTSDPPTGDTTNNPTNTAPTSSNTAAADIPEPASLVLVLAGLAGLRRRRRR